MPKVVQITPRMLASRRNARLGGLATAKNHDEEWRTRRAEKAGNTVLERYGIDYFKNIRKKRRSKKTSRLLGGMNVTAFKKEVAKLA